MAASGAAPAFDPQTALLYVNANEMPWYHKLVERNDKSLFGSNCATCHGDDLKGSPDVPTLVGVGTRKTRDELAQAIRQGTGRMPGFAETLDNSAVNDLVTFLITGHDVAEQAGTNPNYLKYRTTGLKIFLDPDGYPPITPPWGTLNAIDLNEGKIRWSIPFGEYPDLAAKGVTNTGSDSYGGPVVTGERAGVHRRDDVRQEIPRLRQAHRRAALGDHPPRVGKRDAVALHG